MKHSHVTAYKRALARADQLLYLLPVEERDHLYDQWEYWEAQAQNPQPQDTPLLIEFLLAEQNVRSSLLSTLDDEARTVLWLRARSLALQAANQLAAAIVLAGKEGCSDELLLSEFATPSLRPTLWPNGRETLFHPQYDE